MKIAVILRGLVVIISLVILGFIMKTMDLDAVFDKVWVDEQIRGQGLQGELLFVAVGALVTAVGMPRQLVGFLAGYAFGFVWGSLWSLLAAVLGCMLSFTYARLLGRQYVKQRFSHRIQRLDYFIHDHPIRMTLLIRLLPLGSNLITNLAAGVSSVRGRYFFLGSGIGYIPQMLIFALIGSGINLDPVLRIGIGVALFLISAALGVSLYRHFRHGQSPDEHIEEELGDVLDDADQRQ